MAALPALLLAGCATIGPHTVARDRFDYVSAISDSWKRQTLLNLLKTRYMDAPVFMDVASVINQYTLQTELDAEFTWADPNEQFLGGKGLYADRPTITYNPMMGEKFARSLLLPLPIPSVMLLIQYGYPADQVMQVCVQSINGLKNRRRLSSVELEADPNFTRALELFRRIVDANGIALRVKRGDDKAQVMLYFRPLADETHKENVKQFKDLLGLDPESTEFHMVHGQFALDNREIAIMNRGMLQIMTDLASQIDVPESDVSEGRVVRSVLEGTDPGNPGPTQFRVHNSPSKPDDAFVAVPYRGYWFWIDDRDVPSKRAFQFLLTLFSFTERGESERFAPVITVPTN